MLFPWISHGFPLDSRPGQAAQFNVGDGWAIASINGTEILEMPFVKVWGNAGFFVMEHCDFYEGKWWLLSGKMGVYVVFMRGKWLFYEGEMVVL